MTTFIHSDAQSGMSLRQAYKIAALQGAIRLAIEAATGGTAWTSKQIVAFAAELAADMLAEDEEHAKT